MEPRVLIADDDQAWLNAVNKRLGDYAPAFVTTTALGSQNALAAMEREPFLLVVAELRMRGMDGFELLSLIRADYPDVPVIIVTAYDQAKTKEVVLGTGAAGYLVKPFHPDSLAKEITRILEKISEGGVLKNVSLETFLQLVEMEQRTCTLHVLNPAADAGGALFFRDGELYNARSGKKQGKAAAYEILSWPTVMVSIENACLFEENRIGDQLQAILLDAMRSRDEGEEDLPEGGDPIEVSETIPISADPEPIPGLAEPRAAIPNAALLEIIEKEKLSCFVKLKDGNGDSGYFSFRNGEPFDAAYRDSRGVAAAIEIIRSKSCRIELLALPDRKLKKQIRDSLSKLIEQARK
jgi:DNA-binding response OmpR family regulator